MARLMFPYKWSDGTWRDGPETQQQPLQVRHINPGVFTERPLSPSETRARCNETRQWLITLLRKPTPASQVWALAKRKGISDKPLRRAKRHFKIKSYRVGGYGGKGCWIWALT